MEIGFLSLQDRSSELASIPLPESVRPLGHLGLRVGASTSELDATAGVFAEVVRGFSPSLILAGPVHDAGYIVARSRNKIPWVIQPWAFDVFWEILKDSAAVERSRTALSAASAIFVDCAAVLNECARLVGWPLAPHYQMPWGLELKRLRRRRNGPSIRRRLGIDGRSVFICTRSMEPIYGVDTVLESFRRVHLVDQNTVLLWPGNGSLLPYVENYVQQYGLGKAVLLFGSVEHERVIELLSAADCYLSCSNSDGTSLSLLEAMFSGLPVIVSDVGGNPEWVSTGENGWLIDQTDSDAFSRAMILVKSLSIQERRRISDRNLDSVRKRANLTKNFPKFINFLSQAANQTNQTKSAGANNKEVLDS